MMKKLILGLVLSATSLSTYADDTLNQQLAEKIAYSRGIGDLIGAMYKANPTVMAKNLHWKVDTADKRLCINNNANDTTYAKLILPDVQSFANTQTPQKLQAYLVLLDNGLAEGVRNLIFTKIKPQPLTDKQTTAITMLGQDENLLEFSNFYTHGVISAKKIDNQTAYNKGRAFGREEAQRFANQISIMCNLK